MTRAQPIAYDWRSLDAKMEECRRNLAEFIEHLKNKRDPRILCGCGEWHVPSAWWFK